MTTYCGASKMHLHVEDFHFDPNIPLKIFNRDEIFSEGKWITFTNCSGTLSPDTFINLPHAETIDINKCNIEKIENNTFSSIKNLQQINIRKSTLCLDEHSFKECEKLKNISFIQIDGIEHQNLFKDLRKLNYLMFDHINGLNLDKLTFSGLENLKYLYIAHCKITQFHENVFDELKNLKTLYFTKNSLKNIVPSAFLKLKNLKLLGIYDNDSIPEIDYEILLLNLTNLETICFPEEFIKTINFKSFKNLKTVQLVIDKAKQETFNWLQEKENINVEWTSDSDLTVDVDLSDPNIQICG